jgi:hypothetical protein
MSGMLGGETPPALHSGDRLDQHLRMHPKNGAFHASARQAVQVSTLAGSDEQSFSQQQPIGGFTKNKNNNKLHLIAIYSLKFKSKLDSWYHETSHQISFSGR